MENRLSSGLLFTILGAFRINTRAVKQITYILLLLLNTDMTRSPAFLTEFYTISESMMDTASAAPDTIPNLLRYCTSFVSKKKLFLIPPQASV
jgi:hypothetical protein